MSSQASSNPASAGAQSPGRPAALSGADIAASLRLGFADPAQQDAVTQIGQLIDEGQAAVASGEADSAGRVMPAQGGTAYGFTPGTFYRIDAVQVINDTAGEPFSGAHSDIKKTSVAQLAAATAAAHA